MSRGQKHKLQSLHSHAHFASAVRIVETLRQAGYTAVFAGGCVRDGWLGSVPKDMDIATDALPEAIERLFARTLSVGKAFGTIVVIEDGLNFEVTTFRRDGPYLDGRRPARVEFSDMKEDALRRDFTVNALFYDERREETFDFVGGIEDLKQKYLRTVGKPELRFGEDHLRMLRAVRFVAQLGFALEEATLVAIQRDYHSLRHVSSERIFNEMRRLLQSPFVLLGLGLLRDSHLDEVVWPELALAKLERLPTFMPFLNWENAFSAVMLLANAHAVESRLRAWNVSRENLRRVNEQIRACKTLLDPKSKPTERAYALGGEVFAEALQLAKGFLGSQSKQLEVWIKEYLKVAGPDGKLPKAILNGQDLLAAGVAPGAEMGRLLKELFAAQLEGRIHNRDEALSYLKQLLRMPK